MSELATLEWALGLFTPVAIATIGGAMAQLHSRINALAEQLAADRRIAHDDVAAGDSQLRHEIGEIRNRVMDQPTKEDMRDMERRLTSLVSVGRTDMEYRLTQVIRDHQEGAEGGTIHGRDQHEPGA